MISSETIFYSNHGERRRQRLGVRHRQIQGALREGDVIETFPDAGRGLSTLLLHWIGEDPLHVVAEDREQLTLLVTVYDPRTVPDAWIDNYSQRQMADAESTPDGMQCMHCPVGTYRDGTTTMTFEREDVTLVVKEVPAYVCPYCGDALLSEEVSKGLDDAMDEAIAAKGTTVREYDAAT